MSENPAQQVEAQVDAYLDGLMSAAERADFERRIEVEPALQQQVRLQQEIDAALRRRLAPPAASEAAARVRARIGSSGRGVLRLHRYGLLATAALVAFGSVGLWQWMYHDMHPTRAYWQRDRLPMATAYRFIVSDGFEADWECDGAAFAGSVWVRLGEPVYVPQWPEGTKREGLSYVHAMSRDTMALLAWVAGERVVVFIDRLEHDPGEAISALDELRTGLNEFRGQVGGLVMYEVSPFDEPHVLPLIQKADFSVEQLKEGARSIGIEVD